MSTRGETTESGHALIAVEPPIAISSCRPAHRHGVSALVAQLLATRDQLPQTRDKRRVEPAQAVAFYQAVGTFLSAPPTQPGLDIRA
ncbi:hypothetical protein [Candidatus Raskinella chloraquaticus]|uniref:Uncharacterized protein n=1 Tax=Candidatus Raskinella chloraquaticus TaxID=1951219 RepID=A0A1W9HYQ6_9HYPH|nr:MAG: hypothetical protein A4S15_06950 [Proteobacteria bacterium SG_bin8]